MLAAKYACDFIALQETRRDGRTTIEAPAAGYVVHCNGHCDGDVGKPGILGVGLAVRVYRSRTRPRWHCAGTHQCAAAEGEGDLQTQNRHNLHRWIRSD